MILMVGDMNAQMTKAHEGVTGNVVLRTDRNGMTARKAQASERLHDFVESAGMWTASTGQEAWQGAIRKAGTWRLPGTFDGRVRMVQLDYTFVTPALKRRVMNVENRWGPCQSTKTRSS